VAHAYNSSQSGVRDQEDCSLKPSQAKSLWTPSQPVKAGSSVGHLSSQLGRKHKQEDQDPVRLKHEARLCMKNN
jgi:hypothetical protein